MSKALKVIQGKGRNNIYLVLNEEISLLILNYTILVIVDTKWVDELKNISINYRYKSNGNLDAYCKMLCSDNKQHYIPIGKIVADLASGKVSHLDNTESYNYDLEECHHKYARIDNRTMAVESLTKEEHKKRHTNDFGGNAKSHHTLKLTTEVDIHTGQFMINTDTLVKYLDSVKGEQ